MSEPLEGATLPQAKWEPPGDGMDFDSIFGGAGDGSSDIVQVEEAVSEVEPVEAAASTETQSVAKPATSEVKQTTLKTDPESGFLVETETGTKYRNLDEVKRGTEEKDRQLLRMRRMLETEIGIDPLNKRNQQTADSDVSYLDNSSRFASDLTRAAELGQKTGNWDAYRDTQARLQREIIQRELGPYLPAVQSISTQRIVKDMNSEIPDFETYYGSEQYKHALEARPALKNAIEHGERNGIAPDQLRELYKSSWDAGVTMRLPELLKTNSNPPSTNQNTRMPMSQGRLSPPATGKPSSTPTLATKEGRKALMEEFERKGGLDRNF